MAVHRITIQTNDGECQTAVSRRVVTDLADRYVLADDPGARDLVQGFSTAQGDRLDLGRQDYTQSTALDGDVVVLLSGGGQVRLDGVTAQQFGSGAGYFVR